MADLHSGNYAPVEQPFSAEEVADALRRLQQYREVPPVQPQQPPQEIYKYNASPVSDTREVLRRSIKYALEGIAVALVAYYFTKNKLEVKEVLLLGITAAFGFAILDTFSPTISLGARFGAGFGIGQTMFGVNPATAVALL